MVVKIIKQIIKRYLWGHLFMSTKTIFGFSINKIIIVLCILFVIGWIVYLTFFSPESNKPFCESDACFNTMLAQCSPAWFVPESGTKVIIGGKTGDLCSITMISSDMTNNLHGFKYTYACSVPLVDLDKLTINSATFDKRSYVGKAQCTYTKTTITNSV